MTHKVLSKKYSSDIVAKAISMYESDTSISAKVISEKLGVPPGTIIGWIKRSDAKTRTPGETNSGKQKIDQELVKKISVLYEEGVPLREIADRFGFKHTQSVSRHIANHTNLELRRSKETRAKISKTKKEKLNALKGQG